MQQTGGYGPHHPQVEASNGLLVDVGIRDLLECLWARGIETYASCQELRPEEAWVFFETEADRDRFEALVGPTVHGNGANFPVHFPSSRIAELVEVMR